MYHDMRALRQAARLAARSQAAEHYLGVTRDEAARVLRDRANDALPPHERSIWGLRDVSVAFATECLPDAPGGGVLQGRGYEAACLHFQNHPDRPYPAPTVQSIMTYRDHRGRYYAAIQTSTAVRGCPGTEPPSRAECRMNMLIDIDPRFASVARRARVLARRRVRAFAGLAWCTVLDERDDPCITI